MHATVLLNMSEPEHAARLERLAREAPPIHMGVRELFVGPVERITDAEVFCIGVSLASPGLRSLKDAWLEGMPEGRRQEHVPYEGEGHISLAYIRAEHKQEAEDFVRRQGPAFQDGRSLTVESVSYTDEWGGTRQFTLNGPSPASGGQGIALATEQALFEIDGSVLEGGGQILRMSSGYAALLQRPIRISKIRAGRSKPGLAAQHLESLRLVRDVSAGQLTNDRLQSCEIVYRPGSLQPGCFSADPKTAGAITLMIQASLAPLMLAGGASSCDLKGGTDVSFSPPLDFFKRVLLPQLERMGAKCTAECVQRGFFPNGGGHVRVCTPGLHEALKPIDLSERGEVQSADATLYTTRQLTPADEKAALDALYRGLGHVAPRLTAHCVVENGASGKLWADVVVRTSTGALFHGGSEPRDLPGFGRQGGGKRGAKGKGGGGGTGGEDVASLAAAAAASAEGWLRSQLATGAAVDEHLADQLILPASLADGTSRILCGELSLHCQTAIHIAKLFLPGAEFRQEARGKLTYLEVRGVGYRPSVAVAAPAAPAAPAAAPAPAVAFAAVAPPRPAAAGGAAAGAAVRVAAAAAPLPAASCGTVAAAAAAAAPPPAAAEISVRLAIGLLSQATQETVGLFRNDISQLAAHFKVRVVVDADADELRIGAGPRQSEAEAELQEILEYYFGAESVWRR